MARLLRIERAIRWMATTLTANRDALPFPEGITNQINPTIDIFGSQRVAEQQIETVQGTLGLIEITHGPTPEGSVRYYLSMEFEHDDPIDRRLRPGRIIPTGAGFPFAAFGDSELTTVFQQLAVRNFTVGPGAFAAVRASAIAAAARMVMTVVWIEMPLGEYVNSIE